jgi:hypothetical protein
MESLIGAVPFQVARTSVALAGAGAYDASPLAMICAGFDSAVLYFSYTRGGAAGAFKFKIEVSPHASDSSTYDNWFQATIYDGGTVTAGADTTSTTQREEVSYTATSANEEKFAYGQVQLGGGIQRMRVVCAESGNVGAPGTLQALATFWN